MPQKNTPQRKERMRCYADRAYARCCDWFGPPDDPQRPYKLVLSNRSNCGYLFWRYWLFIEEDECFDEICSSIGHEMFHRVTIRRKNWPHIPWIEEMMAFLASQRLLRKQGMQGYAEAYDDRYMQSLPGKVDVSAVRRIARYPNRCDWSRGISLPADFYYGVGKLGMALQILVSWEQLCPIVAANTPEEWVASLPLEKQPAICRILDMPYPGDLNSVGVAKSHTTAQEAQTHYLLGLALNKKGDFEGAVEELQEALRIAPDANKRHWLGMVFFTNGHFDEAIRELRAASLLDPSNAEIHYTIGSAFQRKGELEAAITELRETVRLRPNHAAAYYYLGVALNDAGFRKEAFAAWQNVLTLDQSVTARFAQEMLDKHGALPARATIS